MSPWASGWAARENEKDTTLMAIREGVNILQFCSVSNFLLHANLAIKGKVYSFKEVFARLYSLRRYVFSIYIYLYICAWIRIWVYNTGLCIISVFFVLMIRPTLWQAREFINTVLHVDFDRSVQCRVVGEQKLVDDISLHFGLCLKFSEVEDRAVRVVSNVYSIFWAIACIK